MRNRILLGMIAFGFSAFLMGSATMAWFTSSTEISDVTFSSGTIEIQADGLVTWTEGYNNMAPDQTIESHLTVTNVGTLTMKYRMYGEVLKSNQYPSDQGLADALELTILDKNQNRTIYQGSLSGFNSSSPEIFDGTEALAPGKSDEFVFKVYLPWDAGNELAGKKVWVSFHFDATQPENKGWTQNGEE